MKRSGLPKRLLIGSWWPAKLLWRRIIHGRREVNVVNEENTSWTSLGRLRPNRKHPSYNSENGACQECMDTLLEKEIKCTLTTVPMDTSIENILNQCIHIIATVPATNWWNPPAEIRSEHPVRLLFPKQYLPSWCNWPIHPFRCSEITTK